VGGGQLATINPVGLGDLVVSGVEKVQGVLSTFVQGAGGVGVAAVNKIDLAPPPNTYPVYARGAGAAEGPLPPGYTTVSRWVSPEEASLWVQNQGTAIPAAVPRNGTPQVYVSEAGAPRAPGATGTVRIDFAVPDSMLQTGNASNNSIILQPSISTPIYNVKIHVPNGMTLPKAR
jgi:filamentous hemagglutinin